ncbi:helix-turn-helix domain-containing protein [Micromonospora matsumotoense]|uniref:helix-turn-helix domain-containing protein n=1 Tax=Micromonospora matsumotoense TaxID=121616 RepID=UPI003D8D7779
MTSGPDYQRPGVWAELVERLGRRHPPWPRADCGRVECEPGWAWRPVLADHDAWLVVRGRGWASVGGERVDLHPGRLIMLRPGDRGEFGQDPHDRLTVLYCHFDFRDAASGEPAVVADAWLPARFPVLRHAAPVADLMRRVVRLSRDPHPLRRLDAAAALLSLLTEVYRQDAHAHGEQTDMIDPRLQEVIDLVRGNPGRRPSLDEAARLTGLAPAGLSRLFSRQLGVSFRQFVIDSRLERARQLLTESSMTVGQIARALGYPDVFLFSRQFRRRYGEPPSALRRTSTPPGRSPG